MKTLLGDVRQFLDMRMDRQKEKIENLLATMRPILDLQEENARLRSEQFNVDQPMDRQKEKIENLLATVHPLLALQTENARLRGEQFNVFEILGRAELEKTHSDFIGELLNPKGSHRKGDIFLKLFLCAVGNHELDATSACVELEKYIGTVDYSNQTGGKTDIYIEDKQENSITIENKIHAGHEPTQIERYCNHNKDHNTVYYLTLSGDGPEQAGEYEAGRGFWNISYKEHVIPWLERCLKESEDQPVLRETIRQYVFLLRRLTTTMHDEHEKSMFSLMLRNYDEAQYIAENFSEGTKNLCEEVRESVVESLQGTLADDRYTIETGDPITNPYAKIFIKLKGYEKKGLWFGIESFGSTGDSGNLFVGVYIDDRKKHKGYKTARGRHANNWWADKEHLASLADYKEYVMAMQDGKTLLKLHEDEHFKKKFIRHIVNQTQKYLDEETKPLLRKLK